MGWVCAGGLLATHPGCKNCADSGQRRHKTNGGPISVLLLQPDVQMAGLCLLCFGCSTKLPALKSAGTGDMRVPPYHMLIFWKATWVSVHLFVDDNRGGNVSPVWLAVPDVRREQCCTQTVRLSLLA